MKLECLQHTRKEWKQKKRKSAFFVLVTHLSGGSRRNYMLLSQQMVKEEEGISHELLSFFRRQCGRGLSKNGLRDEYRHFMCVGMSLSELWQRGRTNLTPNGGKYAQTVPTFQRCDLLSAHRYSQTHAPRFQGQIQLQACGIKVNTLVYGASSSLTPNVHK